MMLSCHPNGSTYSLLKPPSYDGRPWNEIPCSIGRDAKLSRRTLQVVCAAKRKRGEYWCHVCPPARYESVQLDGVAPRSDICVMERIMENLNDGGNMAIRQDENQPAADHAEDVDVKAAKVKACKQPAGADDGLDNEPSIAPEPCHFCGQPSVKYSKRCGLHVCGSCKMVLQAVSGRPDITQRICAHLNGSPLANLPPKADTGHKPEVTNQPAGGAKPYSANPNLDAMLRQMGAIHDAKSHDYACPGDPLGNFREAQRLGLTTLQSVMVRLSDKYTRACNLVARGGAASVADETLDDTLLDLSVYACLARLACKLDRQAGGND